MESESTHSLEQPLMTLLVCIYHQTELDFDILSPYHVIHSFLKPETILHNTDSVGTTMVFFTGMQLN